MGAPVDYPLGHSGGELQRLTAQASFYEDLTEDVLRRAGLRPGMRVLDVGCGAGDVSLLAARLVGPVGTVVGIDRAGPAIECATRRAAAAGLVNVEFGVGELDALDREPSFDALVGRFVLMYLPDPAVLLRRLARCLRPGGIVAFQEMDISQAAMVPSSPLFDRSLCWLRSAFEGAGAELDMGSKLLPTFLNAGLPRPTMIASARVESGPDTPAYQALTGVLQSLLPIIERLGIADAGDIGIETLARRLRDDALAGERVMFLPTLVGSWSRLGS